MPFEKAKYVWMDGKLVPWDGAKIHILSHVVHYGTSVFEGFRCYKTKKGPAIFRLKDHTKRLSNSAKIYRMDIPYSQEEIDKAIIETIKANELEDCYIRPLVYRGYEELGVNPFNCPVRLTIAVWYWGKYLGAEALEKGVDVMVSSWNRMAPNTFPGLAKCGANYMNSQLIKMEALKYGFVEGIALDNSGFVSEGSGENIFLVRNKTLITPPVHATILEGITRDSVMRLAKDLGYAVKEDMIPREMLYLADELFFTGSAAEITPIRSVDKIPIGKGEPGEITKTLQAEYLGIAFAEKEDRYGWLTFV